MTVWAAVIGMALAGCRDKHGHGHQDHSHGDSGAGQAKVDDHIDLEDLEASEDPTVFIDGKHDVNGYLAVSWFFKSKDLKRAFRLVDEGLTHNPDAFQLYGLKGQLTLAKARNDSSSDLKHPDVETKAVIMDAQQLYRKAAELGLKERLGTRQEDWPNDKDFDVRDAVRKDVLIEEQHGNLAEMQRLAAKYIEALGGDEILQRKLN
jgi:hypothetical protein